MGQKSTAAKTSLASAITVATLMLFSMFFGAGNLIFPPILGASAGEGFTLAIIGFLLAGVALPVVSTIAVAVTGNDIIDLARRGGPIFGVVFPVLVYLAIGAFYALPRTAVVSFSTAVTPITGWDSTEAAVIFSALFFGASLALAFDPSNLVDKLGKYLTPMLLILLVALVVLSVLYLDGKPMQATEEYADHPLSAGLIQGYFTMDSLAALAFGIVVVSSLRHKGITDSKLLVRGVSYAAIGAGALLMVIYLGLGYIGHIIPNPSKYSDGAVLLTDAAQLTMGTPGLIVFGLIVLLACLTTSVGLIGATSEFFNRLVPKISYRNWAILFSIISFGVSIKGLKAVLSIAGPIIGFLYPIAITLVFISLIEPLFRRKLRYTFVFGLFTAVVWAGLMSLNSLGIASGFIETLIGWSPMHDQDLGWALPAAAAIALGIGVDTAVMPAHKTPAESPTESQPLAQESAPKVSNTTS
ncbi:branched-chain amino acid transport system II carrier protein [Corynebacterium freiburgense]|uniref:branched-chain amino acid transport system II carrier protein n=1 Tax=Corynebacterium freiburgense TaxID=556548 RepID=UPI0004031B9D|nr:branched-chain amino acid transport system II carrier protein [Corynebacterium freiburgense]WJZ03330.1 Branched-chain amino acid transport system 2 carrier protein [Corynebacterium freiburgense]